MFQLVFSPANKMCLIGRYIQVRYLEEHFPDTLHRPTKGLEVGRIVQSLPLKGHSQKNLVNKGKQINYFYNELKLNSIVTEFYKKQN